MAVVAAYTSFEGYKDEATGETVIDPGSGETLRVYFQPSTGKRVYVRVERAKTGGG